MDEDVTKSAMGPLGRAFGAVEGMFKGSGGGTGSTGGLKVGDIAKGVAEGLKDFFSNGAMSAKWTKSIYDAVMKQEDEEDEEEEQYCKCGEPLDKDCQGRMRCPVCDGPCPDCSDGGGPS